MERELAESQLMRPDEALVGIADSLICLQKEESEA
jgi:hypothetical protein